MRGGKTGRGRGRMLKIVGNTLPKGSEISDVVSVSPPAIMGLGEVVGCFGVKGTCVLGSGKEMGISGVGKGIHFPAKVRGEQED